ncbi:unnamed protein product [Rotaria sordida]|uniref:Uncharacterized protein n=1 Tax=Rotaria sordida TaxID=392033 RepID=A0A815DFA2_9BILA|nr:unnamed protein product [Rotaria sordida]CAF1296233.1 unnamed protein product [Rotaria sordida]CAF3596233.1 unnamed protein product [Rotaria sordida]CAF3623983.1 unnamed protein product [Rotaria sordida]
MFVWWLIGSIGYLYIGIIFCQDNSHVLADMEPQSDVVQVQLSVNGNPPQQVINETNNIAAKDGINTETVTITTAAPEPFSCHECTDCHLIKSDNVTTRVCETGINMCYKMYKQINNVSRLVHLGCSTSKGQCTVPEDYQPKSFESITCCTSQKCNQATQVKISFFLSSLSLFSLLVIIYNK